MPWEVHAISSIGRPYVQGQIREDRYYAAHLLGDLKDARAIPNLVPLLTDPDVTYTVPWSLGQIGDPSAIPPLTGSLSDPNPTMRVLAIYALAELKATEALPRLRMLLDDHASSNCWQIRVRCRRRARCNRRPAIEDRPLVFGRSVAGTNPGIHVHDSSDRFGSEWITRYSEV
jgi:hypothetical protein